MYFRYTKIYLKRNTTRIIQHRARCPRQKEFKMVFLCKKELTILTVDLYCVKFRLSHEERIEVEGVRVYFTEENI
jgi:hypothetical protein